MVTTIFILFIIFSVSAILSMAFGFLNYRYRRKVLDYYVMFIIGIGWTLLGFAFKMNIVILFGITFSLIGYFKKDKWDSEDDIDKKIRSSRQQTDLIETIFIIIIFLGIIALLGTIAYIYFVKIYM